MTSMCFKQCNWCYSVPPKSTLQDKALIPLTSARVGSENSQQRLSSGFALPEEGWGYSLALRDWAIPGCKSPATLPQLGGLSSSRAQLRLLLPLHYSSPSPFLQSLFLHPTPTGVDPESSTPQKSACLEIFVSESASREPNQRHTMSRLRGWVLELDCLGSNPGPATFKLSSLAQVTL